MHSTPDLSFQCLISFNDDNGSRDSVFTAPFESSKITNAQKGSVQSA